jgi:hypothetical protein
MWHARQRNAKGTIQAGATRAGTQRQGEPAKQSSSDSNPRRYLERIFLERGLGNRRPCNAAIQELEEWNQKKKKLLDDRNGHDLIHPVH